MSKLEEIKGRVSVKGVKTVLGDDGPVSSCSLYFDGARIGTLQDSSTGGPPTVVIPNADVHKLLHEASMEQAAAEKFHMFRSEFNPHYANGDLLGLVLYPLISAAEVEKQLKTWCRTKTVLSTNTPGEYIHIFRKYDQARDQASLKAEHPGAEIINDRFL